MKTSRQKEVINYLLKKGRISKKQAFLAKSAANIGHVLGKTKLNKCIDINYIAEVQKGILSNFAWKAKSQSSLVGFNAANEVSDDQKQLFGFQGANKVGGNQKQIAGIEIANKVGENQIQFAGIEGVDEILGDQSQFVGIKLANKIHGNSLQFTGFEHVDDVKGTHIHGFHSIKREKNDNEEEEKDDNEKKN